MNNVARAEKEAIENLQFYFEKCFDWSGKKFNNDNRAEIRGIVQNIIFAATEPLRLQIADLQEQIDRPDWKDRR